MLIVFVATIVLTVGLYIKTPKGYFPQDDTGLIFGGTIASPDISFDAMKALQLKAMDVVLADPAVAGLGSSVGASNFNAAVNFGRLFITLKPLSERGGLSSQRVIARIRPKLAEIQCLRVFMFRHGTLGRLLNPIRNTSSRCGAPTSRNCRSACRAFSTG
jgi:multidrug efflux pump